eukprot:7771047-Heterocapsa_arctica.AAC.1
MPAATRASTSADEAARALAAAFAAALATAFFPRGLVVPGAGAATLPNPADVTAADGSLVVGTVALHL